MWEAKDLQGGCRLKLTPPTTSFRSHKPLNDETPGPSQTLGTLHRQRRKPGPHPGALSRPESERAMLSGSKTSPYRSPQSQPPSAGHGLPGARLHRPFTTDHKHPSGLTSKAPQPQTAEPPPTPFAASPPTHPPRPGHPRTPRSSHPVPRRAPHTQTGFPRDRPATVYTL